MLENFKKPYSISLWEDVNVFVIQWVKDASGKTYVGPIEEVEVLPQLDPSDQRGYKIVNQFFRETKVVNIGSNSMTSPIRAHSPVFKTELNGSHTLTFQVFYRYYDEDTGEYKANPFIDLLANERKVKLLYDDIWYDLIIKKADESSDQKYITYTCTDMFINELSKNGFSIELDTELENNQGTITELAEYILEDTDWTVGTSDLIKQKNEEALYVYLLANDITATCMDKFDAYEKDKTYTISKGQTVYLFYSSIANQEKKIQFFWCQGKSPVIDDDGYILNSPNFQVSPSTLFGVSGDFDWSTIGNYKMAISSTYRGEKLISQQKAQYVQAADKYCGQYSKQGKTYWGYTDTSYGSVDEVKDLLTNGCDFTSINGWSGVSEGTLRSDVLLSSYVDSNDKYHSALTLDFGTLGKVENTGLYDHRAYIDGLKKGDSYIFAIKILETNDILNAPHMVFKKAGATTIDITFTEITSQTVVPDSLKGYKVYKGTVGDGQKLSYNDLILYDASFYVYGNTSSQATVVDAKLFKYVTHKVGTVSKLLVPDLEDTVNSIIKTVYYFFDKSKIDDGSWTEANDIVYSDVFYEGDSGLDNYIPIYSTDYEKIRSITGSKSNCFNLIQSLCETFECWAKFTIAHNQDTGQILYSYKPLAMDPETKKPYEKFIATKQYYTYYAAGTGNLDDNYQYANLDEKTGFAAGVIYYERLYDKKVSFHEYIGKNNDAGFRYGINLQSIQRSVDSNSIVTKLIVEPNSNEYATNGSCTIQLADENPSGETTLFNFDYFVHNNLLTQSDLNNDLYGPKASGIDYYARLRECNKNTNDWVTEQAELANVLNNLIAIQQDYHALLTEAANNKADLISQLRAAAKDYSDSWTSGSSHSDKINEMLVQRDEYQHIYDSYKSKSANNDKLVESYQAKYDKIKEDLAAVAEQKKQLNKEFYKKYSRFIQEGSWISEDYIDENLYYLDAQSVLYTSAFPQVSYTINVLELSQLEGYENYTFAIGDKTYIEDTEFFGYVAGTKRPYQEEIIVSEISYNLDEPSKNTITVQNYKTQFEDLFQRITATTQSLQYSQGGYARAANVIETNGTITASTLENSFKNNSIIISNAKDQSVTTGENGITVTSLTKPNEVIRLVSGGIMLSTDAGKSWTAGITASGINANSVAAGTIDTSQVTISNNSWSAFRWDKDGITAYKFDTATNSDYNYNRFVRLDQYGLYGYSGEGNNSFVPSSENPEQEIIDKAKFSLTWGGFNMKTDDGSVRISSTKDFQVFDNNNKQRIQIGKLDNNRYGMALWNKNGTKTLHTDDNGQLWLSDSLTIGGEVESDCSVHIGYLDDFRTDDDGKKYREVFNANDNFIIYEDGSITANNGSFNGSGSFRGSIYADNGYFSGPITVTKKINGEYEQSTTQLGYIENYEPTGKITEFDPSTNYYVLEDNEQGYVLIDSSGTPDPNVEYYIYRPLLINADGDFLVYTDGTIKAKNGEFTGVINATEAHFENGFQVGEKFSVDADGTMRAVDGSFVGSINATGGTFSGNITATGTIQIGTGLQTITINGKVSEDGTPVQTGIYAGSWTYNDDSKQWETSSDKGFYISNDGTIIAKGLDISGQANITDRLKIGENCYISNPLKYNKEFISVYDTRDVYDSDGNYVRTEVTDTPTLIIESSGLLKIGGSDDERIFIDGKNGSMYSKSYQENSSAGWLITNEEAVFNNITARGSIRSSVLEYGEIQAVGGILIIRPSSIIKSLTPILDENGKETKQYYVELENEAYFNDGDYCKVQVGDDININIVAKFLIVKESGNRRNILELKTNWPGDMTYKSAEGQPLVSYGQKGDVGIAINSSDNESFVASRSLSVFDSNISEDETSITTNTHVIVGQIPNKFIYNKRDAGNTVAATYGLYAENAMIKGAIIAEDSTNDETTVTGIDTNSEARNRDAEMFPEAQLGRIVLWAGAKTSSTEDIETSKFRVDSYGNVYAGSGYFEGTIISNASISAAEIRTATLTGWDVFGEAGNRGDNTCPLVIRDAKQGIQYLKLKNGRVFNPDDKGRMEKDASGNYVNYDEVMTLGETGLKLNTDLFVGSNFKVNGSTSLATLKEAWFVDYPADKDIIEGQKFVSTSLRTDGLHFSYEPKLNEGNDLQNNASIYYATDSSIKVSVEGNVATVYSQTEITNKFKTTIDNDFELSDAIVYKRVLAGQGDTVIGYDIYVFEQ